MKKNIVFIVCTLLVLSVIAGQVASASEEAASAI